MPSGEVHPSVQSKIDSTRGGGTDARQRRGQEKLSPSLGDLSDVRVHTDSTAHDLNHAVSARAFATGTDVYFAQNEYKPNTSDGDKLIAHELAHVVQQRGAPTSGPLDRLESWRRHGERGGVGGGQDRWLNEGRHPLRPTPIIRPSVTEPQATAISFGFIDRRVMAAVERVAGSDPDPGDPFRGLYISDEVALRLTQGDSGSDADARLQARRRGARAGSARGGGARGLRATELNPRYGRLYAYLQDDVTRKLPSPRLVGQLLEGEGLTAGRRHGRVRHAGPAAPPGRAEAARRRADAARRAADQGRRPARRRAARRAHGRVPAADPAADGRAARARPGPRRRPSRRWRAALAPVAPADRARRPGRRHADRHRLRTPAGRHPRRATSPTAT